MYRKEAHAFLSMRIAQAVPATQREERLRDRKREDAVKAKKAWACSMTSGN